MSNRVFPQQFLQKIESQLGDQYSDFIYSQNCDPTISIRLNHNKQPSPPLDNQHDVVPWCTDGLYLKDRPSYITDPLFHAGCYYSQEPSSMIISQLLDNSEPIRVLDMCAAPGGKTLVLADYLHPHSLIVANEFDGKRVGKLVENTVRWGRDNILVTHNRPSDFGAGELCEEFDLVLVDAPCSGEGMFRKDQFAVDQWSPKLIGECVSRQKDILFYSLSTLKIGGKLIYSTCTYNAEENEEIVGWMVEQFGLQVLQCEIPLEWGISETADGCYHCYPHKTRGEGLFFAVLEKIAPTPEVIEKHGEKNNYFKQRSANYKELNQVKKTEYLDEFASWVGELKHPVTYFQIEQNFYMTQAAHFGFVQLLHDSLFIKKYPLKIGEKAKGKGFSSVNTGSKSFVFTPDHEFSQSQLLLDDHQNEPQNRTYNRVEISKIEAIKFLSKQEIIADLVGAIPDGFILLTHSHIPIGWAKKVDSRLQNLLPKGLMIRSSIIDLL